MADLVSIRFETMCWLCLWTRSSGEQALSRPTSDFNQTRFIVLSRLCGSYRTIAARLVCLLSRPECFFHFAFSGYLWSATLVLAFLFYWSFASSSHYPYHSLISILLIRLSSPSLFFLVRVLNYINYLSHIPSSRDQVLNPNNFNLFSFRICLLLEPLVYHLLWTNLFFCCL